MIAPLGKLTDLSHHITDTTYSCVSYVKRAMHGTRMLSWSQIRDQYGRELVNLRNESRWVFLNTLFSVSEAVMYMQVRPHSDP